MFRRLAVLFVFGAISCFIYGVGNLYAEVEENACRMTYMFGEPKFAPVSFGANKHFPNYGLYYYYEGLKHPVDPRKTRMTGAPVIFIPGNAGSYKQVRSMASVALRKAMDNEAGIHLDYYTIDFDEEHSALYGGYLYRQQAFLKHCIRTVISLYRGRSNPTVVLIGHSMGGKLAQSILNDAELSQYINTILSISTPLDQPVLALDTQMSQFYQQTNALLADSRTATTVTGDTNVCQSLYQMPLSEQQKSRHLHSARLDNVLLISTGGGNRDLLVRAGYTSSQFTDIHALTSCIPRVGLSCDHLAAVWCLQFMQVINRFLFSIAEVRADRTVVYNGNKPRNLQLANSYFVKSHQHSRISSMQFQPQQNWHEERRLVINKFFSNGLKAPYHELISLSRQDRFKKLGVELFYEEEDNWLFGCTAQQNEKGKSYCEKATPLGHHIQRLPNGDRGTRNIAVLDLHNIRKTYRHWTHILLRLPPSSKRIGYNLDIYDPKDRTSDVRMPRWYNYGARTLVNETLQGTLHYKVRITDLIEPFQGLRVRIDPIQCLLDDYRITTRLCVPWAAGFERFQTLTSPSQHPSVHVNVPVIIPRHYNTTLNPITLDIYLDPTCRYRISYEYAYADALSRLVLEYYGWLPAHLACVLFIVLKNQVDAFHTRGSIQSLKPYIGYLQFTSLYIVTGCRLLRKVVISTRILPIPEALDYSINISIIIHCAAIALSVLTSLAIWLSLTLYGHAIYRIVLRLTQLSHTASNILVSIMTHLPVTFGILTIGVAIGACSGIALLVAFMFYFMMISNAYKDYLEEYLWQQAVNLLNLGTAPATDVAGLASTVTDPETDNINTTSPGEATTVATSNGVTSHTNANELDPQLHQQLETMPGSVRTEISDADDENNANGLDDEAPLLSTKSNGFATAMQSGEPCMGLQNFPFHITLLMMLGMLFLLNVPATLAWVRSRQYNIELPDPSLYPNIIVLASLSLLLQLKAPQKYNGYWTISVALYLCSGICLLYCQVAIYRLNFIIAMAFALLAGHQGFNILWREATQRFC